MNIWVSLQQYYRFLLPRLVNRCPIFWPAPMGSSRVQNDRSNLFVGKMVDVSLVPCVSKNELD